MEIFGHAKTKCFCGWGNGISSSVEKCIACKHFVFDDPKNPWFWGFLIGGVILDLDLEKEMKANTVNVFVDPVFKKEVDPSTAKHMAGYNGKTYYFCSICSKKLFLENPERYIES